MIKRINIMGASGAGTTTLAAALSELLGYKHFDADDYFWEKTTPPFQIQRNETERNQSFLADLNASKKWVLSGSPCKWEINEIIDMFELVIFLYVPTLVRLNRIIARQKEIFGDLILPNGPNFQQYFEFLMWANGYDYFGPERRSLIRHELWLARMKCPILRIEGDFSREEINRKVLAELVRLEFKK